MASMSLLIYIHQPDLQSLTLEGCPHEKAIIFGLFDGQREKTDLSRGLVLYTLDSASQLGDGGHCLPSPLPS